VTVSAWRTRAALGLPPGLLPLGAYLGIGVLLGPQVLNVVTEDVGAHLDAVVSIALGTLGVVAGLALAPSARRAGRLLAAASIESGVTTAIVASALLTLLQAWHAPVTSSAWAIALVLGTAAAASAAGPVDAIGDPDHAAHGVADLDDVLPILVAAATLPTAPVLGVPGPAFGVLAAIAIGAIVAGIGWLLFEASNAPGERAVFVIGAVAMLGGACAYAGVSPLLAGLVCGVCWRVMPGRADVLIASDLRKFHHPLVLLLLIEAGAQLAFSQLAVWLFAAFMVFRMSGKIAGGWAAARVAPVSGDVLGAYLVSPGVIGVAIARNYQQVWPSDGTAILSAVAAAAVVFETIAPAVRPRGARE